MEGIRRGDVQGGGEKEGCFKREKRTFTKKRRREFRTEWKRTIRVVFVVQEGTERWAKGVERQSTTAKETPRRREGHQFSRVEIAGKDRNAGESVEKKGVDLREGRKRT